MLIKGIKLFSTQDTQQALITILQFGFFFTVNQYSWEKNQECHKWKVEKFSLSLFSGMWRAEEGTASVCCRHFVKANLPTGILLT